MFLSQEVIDIISERPITQCADYSQLLVPITIYTTAVFDRDVAFHQHKVLNNGAPGPLRVFDKVFWVLGDLLVVFKKLEVSTTKYKNDC